MTPDMEEAEREGGGTSSTGGSDGDREGIHGLRSLWAKISLAVRIQGSWHVLEPYNTYFWALATRMKRKLGILLFFMGPGICTLVFDSWTLGVYALSSDLL